MTSSLTPTEPTLPSPPWARVAVWCWRVAVVVSFTLCFVLPVAVLEEHGPIAGAITLVLTVVLWLVLAGRRESFLSVVLLWLLCLLLPLALTVVARTSGGRAGAITGVVAAVAAIALHVGVAPRSVGALLPGCMMLSVLLANVIVAAMNVMVLARGR